MKLIVYIGLLLSTLWAQEISLSTPKEAVQSYYHAMNTANIDMLEKVMVKSSFDTTIEVWALSKALKDKEFHETLKAYGSDPKIDSKVKEAVKKKLLKSPAKKISNLVETPLGKSRCMVRYKEDGQSKQLFTSLHAGEWKIDYKAGRKID